MVPIAVFCFALGSLGLLGFNVWYWRALTHARSQADAYWAVARSWQVTAALAVDAMERSHQKHLAASNPARRDILDSSFLQWNDVARAL